MEELFTNIGSGMTTFHAKKNNQATLAIHNSCRAISIFRLTHFDENIQSKLFNCTFGMSINVDVTHIIMWTCIFLYLSCCHLRVSIKVRS